MGLFDSSIDRRLNHNNQLIKLALLIDWNPIKTLLEKVHKRDELIRSGLSTLFRTNSYAHF